MKRRIYFEFYFNGTESCSQSLVDIDHSVISSELLSHPESVEFYYLSQEKRYCKVIFSVYFHMIMAPGWNIFMSPGDSKIYTEHKNFAINVMQRIQLNSVCNDLRMFTMRLGQFVKLLPSRDGLSTLHRVSTNRILLLSWTWLCYFGRSARMCQLQKPVAEKRTLITC